MKTVTFHTWQVFKLARRELHSKNIEFKADYISMAITYGLN